MSAGERTIIVGAGGFGACWLPAIVATGIDVAAVVDPDRDARAAFIDSLRLRARPPTFDSLAAALEDTAADSVIDSSPFVHRSRHASLAADAGLDLLGAKPLGGSLDEARAIVHAMDANGLHLGVALQMRAFPCFVALRDLLVSGRLGDPLHASVRMALDGRGWQPGTAWRLELAHPLLLEAAIHHFDLIAWILGDRIDVRGAVEWNPPSSPFRANANVEALLEVGGTPVVYSGHFAPPPGEAPGRFDSGWVVQFEGGRVEIVDGALLIDGVAEGAGSSPEPEPLGALNVPLLEDWLARDRRPPRLLASGREGLAAMAALEAATQ